MPRSVIDQPRHEPDPTADPREVLRSHGLQVTAQRVAILRALASHPHATAEGLLDAVRTDIGAISRQAVYDTLATFESQGLVRRIQPIGSPALFEDRVGDNHHHLVCRSCGRVVDVDCAVGATPCLQAADDHGFTIEEAEVAYWGTCPQCRTSVVNGDHMVTAQDGGPH